MADVRPFRGIRYNPDRTRDLDRVITQPYDKVSPDMRAGYLAADAHNFVRLILPDAYERSSELCRQWLVEDVLRRDEAPAFYVYHQEFEALGARHLRKGFIGVVRVDEFEKGTVLPHERTLSKAKADRLNLTRATQKDYEQIFMLFSDPSREVDAVLAPAGDPDISATDEYGVKHRLWIVTDPDRLRAVQEKMRDKVLLIADGHHRYETALNYRRETEARYPFLSENAALRYKTCAFVNVADPGLVIFPTHRFLRDLGAVDWDAKLAAIGEVFEARPAEPAAAMKQLPAGADRHRFVLHAGPGRTWLLELRNQADVDRYVGPDRSADYKALDVVVLHSVLIEGIFGIKPEDIEQHVKYERDWRAAVQRVDRGEFQAVLLMNPTRVEQVRRLAELGERMPQKSTDFYPKLISGLVFFDVDHAETL